MPRNSKKSGGSFAYTQQFNFPLSPCYKPLLKAPVPRLGWHAGGAGAGQTCDAMKTVAEMGVIDKPLTNKLTASETAWDRRYTCPGSDLSTQLNLMKGGKKKTRSRSKSKKSRSRSKSKKPRTRSKSKKSRSRSKKGGAKTKRSKSKRTKRSKSKSRK